MTGLLHSHKMTWVLVLWSGYVATWMVVTDSGPAIVAVWWLAGMIVFGLLRLAKQPPFQQGRGLGGMFLKPGWGQWRVLKLHRTHTATEPAQCGSRPNSGTPEDSKRRAG